MTKIVRLLALFAPVGTTVLLFGLLASTSAQATLWDITVEGQAVVNGQQGWESVIYRYDPADLLYVNSCPPTCFPSEQTSTGPIRDVIYAGVVDGAYGPANLVALFDGFAPYLTLGGTEMAEAITPFPSFFVNPYPLYRSATWPLTVGVFSGGEPGFSWVNPFDDVRQIPFEWFSLTVAPAPLPEPDSLALLLAVLAAFCMTARHRQCNEWAAVSANR